MIFLNKKKQGVGALWRFAVILFLVYVSVQKSYAQPQPLEREYQDHYMSWFSLNFNNDLSQNFGAGFTILHWRQQVEYGSWNIFRAYQTQAYFIWLQYYLSENFTISISPFGYLHELPLAEDGWQFLREPQYEYRFAARLLNENQYEKLNMANRFGFEYRHRTSAQLPGIFWPEYRVRYRLRLSTPIHEKWNLIFRNEIYIAFGRYIQYNLLDQNVAFLGLELNLSDYLSLRFGYTNYFEPLRSGQDFNIVHVLNTSLSLNNLISVKEIRKRARDIFDD